MKKKSILLRAPLLSQSGYGVHSRQVARWLFDRADTQGNLEVHTELLNWGSTPWYTNQYALDGLIGRCFQASANRLDMYDVTIQLQLPNEWYPEKGKFNIGMTAGVESTMCHPGWVDAINKMNLVIVPSEFTKETLMRSGKTTTPIVVVPESFPDALLEQESTEKLSLGLETKFNFLVFGQATGGDAAADRKNLPYTLKWLFEAFHDKPDVGVILKTNMGRFSDIDKMTCEHMLKKLLAEINKPEHPKFYLLHGDMSEREVAALYREPSIKALVTLTHGEGFGLPILEAAASGVPVIATNWSAHTEFLKHGKYIEIDHKLAQIPQARVDNHIWMQGSQWAEVNEAEFKKKVIRFYENSHLPKQWAKDMQGKLHQKYSFEAISLAYTSVLGNII